MLAGLAGRAHNLADINGLASTAVSHGRMLSNYPDSDIFCAAWSLLVAGCRSWRYASAYSSEARSHLASHLAIYARHAS